MHLIILSAMFFILQPTQAYSKITSALIIVLFPWRHYLNNDVITGTGGAEYPMTWSIIDR